MSQHTPGPWVVREIEDFGSILPSIKYSIDAVYNNELVVDCVYVKANANLISMSPQLLLALEDAVTIFRGLVDVVPLLRERVEAYDNLITKARGDQP